MDKLMNGLDVVKSGVKAFVSRDWTMEEKVLLIIDCVLFGIVLGAIWSPKKDKHVTMGSYNSGNGCGNGAPAAENEE